MLAAALRPPIMRSLAAVSLEIVVLAVIVVYLGAHLPSLEAWPTAHNDEARELNAFWVASGADPLARGLDPEFGADPLYKGGLQGLTVGLVLRLSGLGLFQGRLVSLAWGGLLLLLVFLLGRRLYGPLGGLLAVLFLALARPFLLASHMVRPDIVLAAMLAGAAYLALRGLQRGERWSHLAAGLVLGLALDVHLNALAFMPLVGLFYLSRLRGRFWREPDTWLFAAGLAAGALYYLGVRVVPDPGQFASSSAYWVGMDKRPPILSGDLGWMLAQEFGRFQGYFTDDRRLEFAAVMAALLVAGVRSVRRREIDPLLIGLPVALAVFVTIVASKSEFYVVLFYPWLMLTLAGAIAWGLEQAPRLRPVLVSLVVAAATVVFGAADNYEDLATAAESAHERGYDALIAELRPVIPSGASILGPPLYWIGFHEHPYTDYYVWERLRAERRERFSSYVERLQPDLVVLDAKSRHQVSINSPGFLESRGVLLKTVKRVGFDRVEVWKLS